jgi:hypothetical protein
MDSAWAAALLWAVGSAAWECSGTCDTTCRTSWFNHKLSSETPGIPVCMVGLLFRATIVPTHSSLASGKCCALCSNICACELSRPCCSDRSCPAAAAAVAANAWAAVAALQECVGQPPRQPGMC